MNVKTPISALQELMAARKLPLPVYTEQGSTGTSFRCTVHAAGVTAVGTAITKKEAKHESARKALEKLSINLPDPPQIIILDRPAVERPQKNYVGELNEWSSKHGVNYPTYTEGVGFPTSDIFFIKCSFRGKDTLGKGFNKKDAKQDAARRMLEIMKSMDAKIFLSGDFEIIQPVNGAFVENREKIINQYQKLSRKDLKIIRNNNNNTELEAAPEISIRAEDSVEVLQAKLRQYGVQYKLREFQRSPCVMYVRIDGTDMCFLAVGNTQEEATKEVLRDVLEAKKNGLSLSTDLISFI